MVLRSRDHAVRPSLLNLIPYRERQEGRLVTELGSHDAGINGFLLGGDVCFWPNQEVQEPRISGILCVWSRLVWHPKADPQCRI